MPARRVRLFNIAGVLFESAESKSGKKQFQQKTKTTALILMNVASYREKAGRSDAQGHRLRGKGQAADIGHVYCNSTAGQR